MGASFHFTSLFYASWIFLVCLHTKCWKARMERGVVQWWHKENSTQQLCRLVMSYVPYVHLFAFTSMLSRNVSLQFGYIFVDRYIRITLSIHPSICLQSTLALLLTHLLVYIYAPVSINFRWQKEWSSLPWQNHTRYSVRGKNTPLFIAHTL